MGQPEKFSLCYVNREYKPPLPHHYKLTRRLGFYVPNYLSQLLN